MAIGTDTFKHFIPTLWSARLLASLDKNLVFKQMATTEYEGEIKSLAILSKSTQLGKSLSRIMTAQTLTAQKNLEVLKLHSILTKLSISTSR